MSTGATCYERLTDEDLLARLIGVREVRKHYQGRLQPLFDLTGSASGHPKCLIARELVRRWLAEGLQSRSVLTSPAAVKEFLRIMLGNREHEVFACLWLDAQHRCIRVDEAFRGTLTQTSVYPREIVKLGLRANAAAVIFAHNHPSGAAQPSAADEYLTQSLKDALALVEVKVVDHFIVAGSTAISFAERGLM